MAEVALTPAEQIVADWREQKISTDEAQLRLLAEICNAVWIMSGDIATALSVVDDDDMVH